MQLRPHDDGPPPWPSQDVSRWPSPNAPAPPPNPKTTSPWVVVLLVLGGLLVLGRFAVPFGIGAWQGIREGIARHRPAPTGTAALAGTFAITEAYATRNGLLTARYPSNFAAKHVDDQTVLVSRTFIGGEDEAVMLGAVQQPITDDVHEFARFLSSRVERHIVDKGGTFARTGERPAMCLGRYSGLELSATFSLPRTAEYTSRACYFMRGSRGYLARYSVPTSRLAEESPLLEAIQAATLLAP